MQVHTLHPWDLSPREAASLQRDLIARVERTGDLAESHVRLIPGSDKSGSRSIAKSSFATARPCPEPVVRWAGGAAASALIRSCSGMPP